MHYITFADDENVTHIMPMEECHVTALRHQMCVIYKGQVYNVRKGTNFTAGDLGGAIQQFTNTATLLASQDPTPP